MACKAVAEKLITAEQLATMRIEKSCELEEGRVVRRSPAGWTEACAAASILEPLVLFVRRKGLGVVVGRPTGFVVCRTPDTVRAPAVAFVSNEALARADELGGTYFAVAPDLAVEVPSPDNSWEEIEKKVQEYLAAGSKAVWVASPRLEKVHVYEPEKDVRVLSTKDKIEGGRALPGFKAPVKAFFAR